MSLAAVVSRPQRRIGARISLENASAKAYFALLQKHRPEIDARIPGLQWDERPGKVQSYIGVYLDDAGLDDASDWPRQHRWLLDELLLIRDAFVDPIQMLPAGGKLPQVDETIDHDPASIFENTQVSSDALG